jgi:hypothetical protein
MPDKKYLKCLKYEVLRVKSKSKNGFILSRAERSSLKAPILEN